MKQKVKPILAVLVLALLGGLAWHFLRPREVKERWLGYVEAEMHRNCCSLSMQAILRPPGQRLFTLIPSILLSGFIFPFRGMPVWAQWIAEFLPPTHYIRLVRGILLKGWEADMVMPEIGMLTLLLCLFGAVAVWRYRDTIA